jgi:hypothetical protein
MTTPRAPLINVYPPGRNSVAEPTPHPVPTPFETEGPYGIHISASPHSNSAPDSPKPEVSAGIGRGWGVGSVTRHAEGRRRRENPQARERKSGWTEATIGCFGEGLRSPTWGRGTARAPPRSSLRRPGVGRPPLRALPGRGGCAPTDCKGPAILRNRGKRRSPLSSRARSADGGGLPRTRDDDTVIRSARARCL